MENMTDPNFIDYYIIDCAIPSIITIENRYQIDFGNPVKTYRLLGILPARVVIISLVSSYQRFPSAEIRFPP